MRNVTPDRGGGGGGYSTDAWVGRCGAGVQTLTLFKTQFSDFPYDKCRFPLYFILTARNAILSGCYLLPHYISVSRASSLGGGGREGVGGSTPKRACSQAIYLGELAMLEVITVKKIVGFTHHTVKYGPSISWKQLLVIGINNANKIISKSYLYMRLINANLMLYG